MTQVQTLAVGSRSPPCCWAKKDAEMGNLRGLWVQSPLTGAGEGPVDRTRSPHACQEPMLCQFSPSQVWGQSRLERQSSRLQNPGLGWA